MLKAKLRSKHQHQPYNNKIYLASIQSCFVERVQKPEAETNDF